jgi:amidase
VTVSARRRLSLMLALIGLLSCLTASIARATPTLNLETLSGAQEEQMLAAGQITSVDLVRAYLARISALNKSGPGLNAVTQINPDALKEAEQADYNRKHGIDLGPAMGLPITLKDIVDASPMFNSAGDWALRNSFAPDSGVAAELKAHGVVILGKLGLSEWANSFGSQPSGYSNLTGQVLNANDTVQGPSGSSSGSGAASDAALSALTIGTETSGSIISPSTSQSDVGLRPTVGLVPGYGISPIDVSQDTAGPIVRTVTDAAMTLQSIAEFPGSDATANQEYLDLMGPNYLGGSPTLASPVTFPGGLLNDIPAPPASWTGHLPNYMGALTTTFVQGKRIGYNATCTGFALAGAAPSISYSCTGAESAQQAANDLAVVTLANAGATMVSDPTFTAASSTALPAQWEAHATIDDYYKGINPLGATPATLAAEVALDNTDPQEAEKDGNSTHANNATSDDSTITSPLTATQLGMFNQAAFDTILPYRKVGLHSAIDAQLQCPGAATTTNQTTTVTLPSNGSGGGGATAVQDGYSSCPASPPQAPVIAVIGSTSSSSPAAGYPEMVVPMGYTATQRRNIGVDISAGAYGEYNIIGIGYVLEQATHLRQPVGQVDPASYRCAHTVPAEPFASRGHCNPDFQSVMSMLGGTQTILPFSLETTSASTLQSMLAAGTLTSQQLVKAELTRIALANASGPAIQAIRSLNPQVIQDAISSDNQRATSGPRSPLEGIPVFVDDSIDVSGLPTSGGSIALQDNVPAGDATLVAKLKAAGAIIIGDANTTELDNELNGGVSTNMPAGYSSLGGQVLLPNDTNKSVGGSGGGSTGAVATGFSPLAVGVETGTDGAQLTLPAANSGVAAMKPTVGVVSTTGVMPDAPSQDSPGPVGQTVTDLANELNVLAGGATDYTAGLSATALSGKKIATVSDTSTTDSYTPTAVPELTTLGATATQVTPGAATTAPSIVPYEFHKSLDAYLAATPEASTGGPSSLASVISYYNANPTEGLKFGDAGLTAAAAVDYTDPTTTSTYTTNLTTGQTQDQAVIDNILTAGPYSAIMVPPNSALVGIADRAGYPIVTVPDGFVPQNNSTGGDPNGVDFIGTAGSDQSLLGLAYALEHGLNARNTGPAYMVSATLPNPGLSGAPSETFQSDWRCVPGSSFFSPYDCNAGDVQSPSSLSVIPASYPVATDVGGDVTPTLGLTIASATTGLGTFIPGVQNDYTASVAASVISTGGNAALGVSDPGLTSPGKLLNGTFSLASPVKVAATDSANPLAVFSPLSATPLTLLTYGGPVTSDPVALKFDQPISATEPLRSGHYTKTVLFTLSTTSP